MVQVFAYPSKQVLAAGVDTEDIDLSAPSANSASSPLSANNLRDDSHLIAPLISYPTSPRASSVSASGSPSRQNPPEEDSIVPPSPSTTLPALPKYRGSWEESSSSSPDNRRTEGSIYYTTAWGSPYAAASPRRLSWSLSQSAGVDRSRDISPISMRSRIYHRPEAANNTDFLKPSAAETSTRQLHSSIRSRSRSPAQDLLSRKEGKSIKDFTQDWINQYLSGQPRTERSNWLSDDSGSEAPSFITAQNHFADDASDDWLGLGHDDDLLKTPTLTNTRRTRASHREDSVGPQRTKDHPHKRTDTLRQEDFWGFAYDKDPQPTMTEVKEAQQPAAEAEPIKASSPIEKPLPPPPADAAEEHSSISQPPESSSDLAAAKSQAVDKALPVPSPVPSQRFRKKLNWKGKACVIALPFEDQRGSDESGYRLLSVQDVEQRLKKWEDEGYDIRGFTICAPEDLSDIELGGLSRPSFPDPTDDQKDWKNRDFAVSFPNKGEWDAYVNWLQEEKLRALGVSLGDDEILPSVSPASAALSQMTPFPGLGASPPIPTASATSNPLSMPHTFSPHFNQSTNTSNGIASLASPASQFSIQTPFLGVDTNILPGYIPYQPTPPAQGSLTPQSMFNARQVGAMPTIAGTLPNLTSILPPGLPLNDQSAFHPDFDEQSGLPKDSFHNHFGYDPEEHIPGDQLYPVHTRSETPDHFHTSNVEIAQPTPRGHSRGHNLSETLQKGLDQVGPSNYHFEDSTERQLDEDDREPGLNSFDNAELIKSRWALPDNSHHAVQHVPQHMHQFYSENYPGENGNEESDIDTNPSLSGAPHRHGSLANQNPWHESKPSIGSFRGGHQSKLSTSSLNVEAKEFDPTGTSSSHNYAFQGNSVQFPGIGRPSFTFGSASGFNPSASAFNVAAPPFTPGGAGSNNYQSPGSSDFKFSSKSFNVAAPVFNPSGSVNSVTSQQTSSGRTKIFGDVDYSKMSNSSKGSKAIPIVRPDDNAQFQENKTTGPEDENGRPTSDRHKRARRGEASDGEAQFSVSSHALTENRNVQTSLASDISYAPAEGKENALPGQADKVTVDTKAISNQNGNSVEQKNISISEASTWTPFDKKNEDEVVTPGSPMQDQVEEQAPEVLIEEIQEAEQPVEQVTATSSTIPEEQNEGAKETVDAGLKSSILSPTAKPFEYKPAVPEFKPLTPLDQPKPIPEKPKTVRNDLMASRYAVASPPASPKLEPVPSEPTQSEVAPQEDVPEAVAPETYEVLTHDSEDDSPNERELNAIMDQLNDDSDVGIERISTPLPASRFPDSALAPSKEKPHVHADTRSEAPSPSPGRGPVSHVLDVPKLDFDAHSRIPATPSKGLISSMQSPIRHLVNQNDYISDWDDVISSGQEEILANRSRFFDRRVNDLVGSAVEERLSPLERALGAIQESVMTITLGTQNKWGKRSVSAEFEESDADDEDDEYEENASYRTRSPLNQKDRKLEKMKSAILEALAIHNTQQPVETSEPSELEQLRSTMVELHALTVHKLSENSTADLRAMIQEVVSNQLFQHRPRPTEAEEIGADSLMLQIEGLKNMLRLSDERAEREYKMRREAQDSVVELQRLLKVVEDEAGRHSEAAESAEARLLHFKAEKIPYFEQVQYKFDSLEQEHATLKLTLAEVSSKNISLEGALDEYRVTSDHWKRDSEQAKSELGKVQAENEKLRGTIDHLKTRIEDGLSIRQNLSEKFDRLQDEMANVTRDVTRDQAAWRRKEEEQTAKYNELRASYIREVKLREKLENDIGELEQQEREAAKLKFIFGQSQQENARLEELVANLRLESHALENKAARFEREFNEARESSRIEIQRTRTSMESDLEAANSQVNIVRAELEAQIIRLQSQMDSIRLDSDTARERYELLLEEASENKANALLAAANSKEMAVEDQRKMHERALNDLRERHARALHNSSEDRQRAESHLMERLALSDDKVQHLQDRVKHLEEKLEIAKSAARAAAEAAQSAKAGPSHSSSPSMSFSKGSTVPEKISPQALRESILVLQDQLQQREGRIEELEQELSAVDKEAPNKLKEKDTEINWLRELLGVRIDDLQDIIKTVSQPSFDHNAVRDAAIRLKANLQMQQQVGERTLSGQGFPSFPSLAELTASPRALPLAAAAAWGNWRKGRESTASTPTEQTPSKPSNASAFLSGLLTPPSSNLRQSSPNTTAPAATGWRRPSETRPLRNINTTPRLLSSRQAGPLQEPPTTPPLLRRSSYDHDAEPADYDEDAYGEDAESTADGLVSASPKGTIYDGAFGPQIST